MNKIIFLIIGLLFSMFIFTPFVSAEPKLEMIDNKVDLANYNGSLVGYGITQYRFYNEDDVSYDDTILNTIAREYIEVKGEVVLGWIEREVNITREINITLYEDINQSYPCYDNITYQNKTCYRIIQNITGYNITNQSEIVLAEVENFDGLVLPAGETLDFWNNGYFTLENIGGNVDNIICVNENTEEYCFNEYTWWNVSYSSFRESQNWSGNPSLVLPYQTIQLNGSGTGKWLYAQNGSISYNDNEDFVFNNGTDNLLCGFESFPNYVNKCDSNKYNLTSYWTLDEASGTVIDYVGVNNGTNNGSTPSQAGVIHDAYSFDGTDDFIELDNYLLTNRTYSFVTWFKTNNPEATVGIKRILSTTNVPDWGTEFGIQDTTLKFYQKFDDATSVGWISLDSSISSRWYHTVIVYNLTHYNIYLNGTSIYTSSDISTKTPNSFSKFFGSGEGEAESLNGSLDNIMMFNRALSQEDITTLYEESLHVYYGEQQSVLPVLNTVNINNEPIYFNKDTNLTVNWTKGDYNGTIYVNWSVAGSNILQQSQAYTSSGEDYFIFDSGNYSCAQNVSILVEVLDSESNSVTDTDSVIVSAYPLTGSITYNSTLVPQARYTLYYAHNGTRIATGLTDNSGIWTNSDAICGFNITGSACVYGAILNVSNLSQTIETITTRTCNSWWGLVK